MNAKQALKRIRLKTPPAKRSINSCLLILGAPQEEVYCIKYSQRGEPHLYERYSKRELLGWARTLWRRKAKEVHPDMSQGERMEFIKACEAYKTAVRILTKGKKQ